MAVCTFAGLTVLDWVAWREQQVPFGADPLAGRTPTAENFVPVLAVPRPPLVSDFETVSSTSADEILENDELVLGVETGGEARAYPINMLNGPEREIINDKLGGRAIAAPGDTSATMASCMPAS